MQGTGAIAWPLVRLRCFSPSHLPAPVRGLPLLILSFKVNDGDHLAGASSYRFQHSFLIHCFASQLADEYYCFVGICQASLA